MTAGSEFFRVVETYESGQIFYHALHDGEKFVPDPYGIYVAVYEGFPVCHTTEYTVALESIGEIVGSEPVTCIVNGCMHMPTPLEIAA